MSLLSQPLDLDTGLGGFFYGEIGKYSEHIYHRLAQSLQGKEPKKRRIKPSSAQLIREA